MIDDDLLESLPSDPEEAFSIFERKMREKLVKKPEYFENSNEEADFKKAGSTCIYVLESGAKTKIHKYISKIRKVIADTDLTDWKREALSNKLNAFALEIDKDRTRLEALASLYVLAKKEAQEIKPISEQIEKIWDAVSKGGEELWKALPKPKIKGYLEKPQEKIEGPKENFDLDDEIPF